MALEPCVDQERDTIYPPAYPKCGCVPEPTAEDAGKAPVVSVSNVPGAVIVPKQTVTMSSENSAFLSNVNSSLFVVGQECIVEIDGVAYEVTLRGSGGFISTDINNYTYIITYNPDKNVYFFNTQVQGTHTVKITAVEKEAQYTLEPVGHDIIVEITGNLNDPGSYTVHWDYPQVLSKVREGRLVTGMAYRHYNYDEAVDGDTDSHPIPMTDISIFSNGGTMVFGVIIPNGVSAMSLHGYAIMFEIYFDSETGAISRTQVFANGPFNVS